MPQLLHRVPPPYSESDKPAVANPPRRINRANLILNLQYLGIFLSVLGAFVTLYIFVTAERHKIINEADDLELKATANRVLRELSEKPNSHPELRQELLQLYKTLNYRPRFDAKLTVFERAAFGLMVQDYAVPIAEVQVHLVDARQKAASLSLKEKDGKLVDWPAYGCLTDPFGYGCPPAIQSVNDKANKKGIN